MPFASLYFVSHVTGNVSTPDNALGAPDGICTTDENAATSWTSRWRLDSRIGVADGVQSITLRMRKGSNSGNPTVSSVRLFQGGSVLATLSLASGSTTITSTTGEDLVYNFAGSLLTGLVDVDIEVATASAGGGPTARNAACLDAGTWALSYISGLPIETDFGASGAGVFAATSGATKFSSLSSAGTSALFWDAEEGYRDLVPSFGEVLGAEVLALEVLSDPTSNIIAADLTAAGSSSLTLATGRTVSATMAWTGQATVSFQGAAITSAGVTTAGQSTATINTGTKVSADLAASGGSALSPVTGRAIAANLTSAGHSTATLPSDDGVGSALDAAGQSTVTPRGGSIVIATVAFGASSSVSFGASAIRTVTFNASGVATVTLPAVRITTSHVTSEGTAQASLQSARVRGTQVSAQSTAFASWLATVVSDASMASTAVSVVSLLAAAIAPARSEAAGSSQIEWLAGMVSQSSMASAGVSQFDVHGSRIYQAQVLAYGSSFLALNALVIRESIDTTGGMVRPAELRGMNRGPADLSMAVTGSSNDMIRPAEDREMVHA
jgi:hypothetical protein